MAKKSRRRSDSTRAGVADWNWATADEPSERFEAPRPQERVLTVSPRDYEPDSAVRVAPAWVRQPDPLLPPPSVPTPYNTPKRTRIAVEASVGRPRTPLPPTRHQLHLAAFRPDLRPSQPTICDQRQDRRAALFASGVAGRRRSAPGPYKRRPESNYTCRRK